MPNCKYSGCTKEATTHELGGSPQYCAEHYADLWWNNQLGNSGPTCDLRAKVAESWTLTLVVKVEDPYFDCKSGAYIAEKLAYKAVRKQVRDSDQRFTRPDIGQSGHCGIRIRSGSVSESFGAFGTGIKSPEPLFTMGFRPDGKQLAIDYRITQAQKNAVCEKITEWLLEFEKKNTGVGAIGEGFDMMGKNCTSFLKACCDAAGIWFIASRVPAYSSRSGFSLTYSPGMVYSAMNHSSYSYNPGKEEGNVAAPQDFLAVNLNWLATWLPTPLKQ